MESDKDLKVLKKFDNEQEAHLLRAELNANGIPAVVAGDGGVGFVGLDSSLLHVIHVNVRSIDHDAANKIMKEFYDTESREKIGAWKCVCGEQVDEGFYTCWACGTEFEDLNADPQAD